MYRAFTHHPAATPGRTGSPRRPVPATGRGRLDNPGLYDLWYFAVVPECAIGEVFGDLSEWVEEMFDVPYLLAATTVDQTGEVIAYGLFATGVLTAAVVDVTERRIPNRVTYPLIAAGVFVLPWLSQPITGWSLIAPLLGAVASGLFGLINAIAADQGLGDVKLAVAIGAWVAHLGLICWVAGVVISQLLMILAVATTKVRRRRAGLPPDYTPLGPSLAGGAVMAVAITGVQFW